MMYRHIDLHAFGRTRVSPVTLPKVPQATMSDPGDEDAGPVYGSFSLSPSSVH